MYQRNHVSASAAVRHCRPSEPGRVCASLLCRRRRIVRVELESTASTTVHLLVARAEEAALRIRNILARRGTSVTGKVELVAAPTLAAVLNTSPLVHVAFLQAQVDSHAGAIVVDLFLHEFA